MRLSPINRYKINFYRIIREIKLKQVNDAKTI
jgi:hypothetical protein